MILNSALDKKGCWSFFLESVILNDAKAAVLQRTDNDSQWKDFLSPVHSCQGVSVVQWVIIQMSAVKHCDH